MPGNAEQVYAPNPDDVVEFDSGAPQEGAANAIDFDPNALQELTGASSLSELRGADKGELSLAETNEVGNEAEITPEAAFAAQQEAIAAIPREDPIERQANIDTVLAKLKSAPNLEQVAVVNPEQQESAELQESTEEDMVSDMKDFVGEDAILELDEKAKAQSGGNEKLKLDTLEYAKKLFEEKKNAQQSKRAKALLSLGLGGLTTFAAGIATGPAFLGTSALALSLGGPLILAGGALAAGGYAVWGGMKLWHKYKNKQGEKIIENLRIKKAQSLKPQAPNPRPTSSMQTKSAA